MSLDTTTPIGSSPSFESVTPSDTDNLTRLTRALYIGTAGNVAVESEEGDSVTFSAVLGGSILPIRVRRVNSTSTTATNIIALY